MAKRLPFSDHKLLILTRNIKNVNLYLDPNIKYEIIGSGMDKLKDTIKRFKPSIAYNLAWQGIPEFSEENCLINIQSQKEIIDVLGDIQSIKRILVVGTCLEYQGYQGAVNENLIIKPKDLFPNAKQEFFIYASKKFKKLNKQLFWMRVFYAYGLGQREESLIPSLISSYLDKKSPKILNPNASQDFIYIDDVTKGLAAAVCPSVTGGIYNLGSGHLCSISKIDFFLVRHALLKLNFLSSEFSLDCPSTQSLNLGRNFWADLDKASNKLDWKPNVNISTGILEMVKSIVAKERNNG